MLYHLLYPLHEIHTVFNVFKYITFRTIGASLTALAISFILGPWIIKKFDKKKISQSIRTDGPPTHLAKKETPTMGGTLILFSIAIATFLWANLTSLYVWIVLALTIGYGVIGLIDDYLKLKRHNSTGLKGWYKLSAQIIMALIVSIVLYLYPDFKSTLAFPFFKNLIPDLGPLYIPFAVFVIIGTSNAVNLTDGLDGLAIGPVMVAAGTYMIFAYVTGHAKFADYLQINYISGAGELAIFCATIGAAGLGFLWFNAYPAQMFMGDVGSLALGGAIGTVAVLTKHELVLVIVGGIFVLEALSVIVQVVSFKLSGKRIFQMAPIHHHFELKGWAEPKIIVRFWIISIIMALIALSTLKLR